MSEKMQKTAIGMLVAIVYVLSGKLGLIFGAGYGYASAMFPPAGIALACVLIYGRNMLIWIFLGSFILNLILGYAMPMGNIAGLILAIGIAASSTLQAMAGELFMRRTVSFPLVFKSGSEAIRFILTAILLSLISASLSILLLLKFKFGPEVNAGFVWLTWWLGDALGIIIFTPLTLLFIGKPSELWRSRQKDFHVVMICGLILVTLTVREINSWEREKISSEFSMYSQQVRNLIITRFSEQEAFIDQLATVLAGPNHISSDEFNRMAEVALKRFDSTMQAVEWAPLISNKERSSFEYEQRISYPHFGISERNIDGSMHYANTRAAYVPVTFIQPLKDNQAALGFDLASSPVRNASIELSRISDGSVASAPVKLVQERGSQQGVLLVHWVSEGANAPGLTLTVLRMEDFMNRVIKDSNDQVMFRLIDAESQIVIARNGNFEPDTSNAFEYTINMGQRTYLLQTSPTAAFNKSHRFWQSWSINVGALGFMGVLGISMLLASARSVRIENVVNQRTSELNEARNNTEKVCELLKEQSDQFLAIFELSPDGFVAFDNKHCVEYLSPAFMRLTGLVHEEIIGLHEDTFAIYLSSICLPESSLLCFTRLRAMQEKPAERRSISLDELYQETIVLAGPGTRVLSVGLREAKTGNVSQILYFRDITHESEVDRMKSEFLATAAHELRTPMASIYGFSEMLLTLDVSDEERCEFLNIIFDQSKLMTSILNELLDLARIEARGGKDFNITRINLGDLLVDIVKGYHLPFNRACPVYQATNDPIWVRADRSKLTQALFNLLSNAYKYSPDGGDINIDFVRQTDIDNEPQVGIRIRDQGIGMTPGQQERVFERFYRADSSGQISGTGLGMCIVKEIIELHHGSIKIKSGIGIGTTVTLWIPVFTELAALAGAAP